MSHHHPSSSRDYPPSSAHRRSHHHHDHQHQHHHPHHHTDTSPASSSHSNLHPSLQNISHADLQFLRQTQRSLGLSPANSTASGGGGSQGSSTTGGLSLDPNALAALSVHFDGLMATIAARVQTLSEQTRVSTLASHRRSAHVVDRATIEIETLRDILRQCDELETEFLKIKRLGEMVKGFRQRVEQLERRVGR